MSELELTVPSALTDRPRPGSPAAALASLLTPGRRQAIKFCIVGSLGFLVNLLLYGFQVHVLEWAPYVAAVGGFSIAVVHNHYLNRCWTFGARGPGYMEQGARFLVVSLFALGINLALLHALLSGGVDELPAQALGVLAATPAAFLGNRVWTFREGM